MLMVPKVITILGQPFTVTVHPKDESFFRGAPEEAMGSNDLNLQRIRIRGPEDLSPAQAAETLFHEALHGLFYLHGFEHYMADSHDQNETFIRVLAPALMAMLRDNPLLVAVLMGDISVPVAGEIVRSDPDHGHDGAD